MLKFKILLILFFGFSFIAIPSSVFAIDKPSCNVLYQKDISSWDKLPQPECDWDEKQAHDVYQNKNTAEYFRCNYQTQPGQCGALPENTSNCPVTKETYGQCGGTLGLEGENSSKTFEIIRFTDCNGNVSYEKKDLGFGRECDKETPAPTTSPPTLTPIPLPTPRPTRKRVTINYQDININDLNSKLKISLDGIKGESKIFYLPVTIYYSNEKISFSFVQIKYKPKAPTSIPIEEPTPTDEPISTLTPIPTETPTSVPIPTSTTFPTEAPTSSPTEEPSLTPTPFEEPSSTPIPTEVPISIPTFTFEKLKPISIKVYGQELDINSPFEKVRLFLNWQPNVAGLIKVPVIIQYSNGQKIEIPYDFMYSPKASSVAPTSMPTATPTPAAIGAVILDPGHGNPDLDPQEGKTPEGALNLVIAEKTRQFLAEEGITAYLTHTQNLGIKSHYADLQKRVDIINDLSQSTGAKLFVAIHFDSSDYGFKGPRSYFNTKRTFSNLNQKLAEIVSAAMSKRTSSATTGRIGQSDISEDIHAGGCCGPLYVLGPQGVRTIETKPESEIQRASQIPGILSEYFSNGLSYDSIKNNTELVEQISKGYCDGILLYLADKTCK